MVTVTMDIIELDCEQNDWSEIRLLKDRELSMRYVNNFLFNSLTDQTPSNEVMASIVVPVAATCGMIIIISGYHDY